MRIDRKRLSAVVILGLLLIALLWALSPRFIDLDLPHPPGRKWLSISHTVFVEGDYEDKYYVVRYHGIFLRGTKEEVFGHFDRLLRGKGWVKVRDEEKGGGIFYFESDPLPNATNVRYEMPGQEDYESRHVSVTLSYEDYGDGEPPGSYSVDVVTVNPSWLTSLFEGFD